MFGDEVERVVGELPPHDRGHLEQRVRLRRQAVEPAPQRLSHAIGDGDVRQ